MNPHEENENKFSDRKHPAHGVLFVDGQPTIIFDTVCTKDRKPWLATEQVHQLLREIWQGATAWLVGRYVIMPDHIHFFAAATESEIPYENWVKYWKSQFSKRHKNPEHRWLTDHWDVRIRSEAKYEEKWDYAWQNPVRAGLVTKPEDWHFQGVIHELPWK
jgi:putative transposase